MCLRSQKLYKLPNLVLEDWQDALAGLQNSESLNLIDKSSHVDINIE